ncbi:hypothetical protein OIU34_28670 [Pararhizobium sp. BT-229]|uniref:hypothetical protein n=1 Tax=Pararhizobium sp. BT-229 TaxID=2986923 RepID=UPI0021F6CD82|nr:hypothetical protein [Pararhizobium sp. BT-229]MCV9965849.1 hypothetical protein [Pararhizobium sp. BT-229]
MKHSELCAVAHNLADSLASGRGFLVGYFPTEIFAEAAQSSEGHITVDFLTGQITGGQPSDSLRKAIALYINAVPAFFKKHGASISDVREVIVRYHAQLLGNRFTVTVVDARGRRSSAEYGGVPGKRLKAIDELGRLRPKIA